MSDYVHCSSYKVRIYDTDMSTTVFFSNHIKWFDSIALVEYLEEKGVDWSETNQRNWDIAIAHLSFDYRKPLFVNDMVDIKVENIEIGNKSIQFFGSLYKQDSNELVATGKIVYVFVDDQTREPVEIPADLKKVLP